MPRSTSPTGPTRINGSIAVARAAVIGTLASVVVLGVGVGGGLAGCVTSEVERGDPVVRLDRNGNRGAGGSIAGARPASRTGIRNPDGSIKPLSGFDGPVGTSVPVFTANVRAEVQPRGAVAYDEQTLPVVSPDGTRLAVQTGLAPDWRAVLADPNAPLPLGGISIHDLSGDPTRVPRELRRVVEPVLLGRSVTPAGFLVERPRAGGSRWIGLADWETGAIEWLVTEPAGSTNAFATAGPGGWLAWSRRPVGGDGFELVVRAPDGTERTLPRGGGDWVMPRFALDGSAGLFAFVLRGDRLDAVYMDASAGDRMASTIRRTALATNSATLATAYQCLAPDVSVVGLPPRAEPVLHLVHPAYMQAAIWRPGEPQPILLDSTSMASIGDVSSADHLLVTRRDHLFRRATNEARDQIRVLAGLQIPRPTADPERPYVLLQPAGQLIGVTLLKFEPITDADRVLGATASEG
ncbi:MAG: hypothetical protein AB8G96_12585 [Phycisphaerales bacterium]